MEVAHAMTEVEGDGFEELECKGQNGLHNIKVRIFLFVMQI